ncbi:MAG: hypothetical protein LUF78_09590 [Clostridiales bacterium]|nr:hypothetical protein [Clostridiales bacterium]
MNNRGNLTEKPTAQTAANVEFMDEQLESVTGGVEEGNGTEEENDTEGGMKVKVDGKSYTVVTTDCSCFMGGFSDVCGNCQKLEYYKGIVAYCGISGT